ncbi:2-oxo acid dehydrogenase subunit E2 [Melissospora conviva]|uniref:2-oxo acid dehydrogenase subunit E2 n=1 Tax=Melissospora conviva TaxID=3388432 RepID=UPI003B774F92
MADIAVPKLNNNDDEYTITEWLVQEGEKVEIGDALVVIETSKAAEEIASTDTGMLRRLRREGERCRPGDVIGELATEWPAGGVPASYVATSTAAVPGSTEPADLDGLTVTRSAADLIEEHGIGIAALRNLNRSVIRRVDVEGLLRGAQEDRRQHLSQHQAQVAQVVSASHREIPAAFTMVRVPADAALTYAAALTERTGEPIGIVELVVAAVARQRDISPMIFASFAEPDVVTMSSGAHVGVTVDAGSGLFLPVLRDADKRSLEDIADALTDFRISALRNSFRESELAGATVGVSISGEDGVVLTVPMIFPGLACMVSLGAIFEELVLTAPGQVGTARYLNLGVAYDHRLVNGREATAFLVAIRDVLESAERLTELDR